MLISYDVTLRVTSPKITAAFNGKLLETADIPPPEEDARGDNLELSAGGMAATSRTRYCTGIVHEQPTTAGCERHSKVPTPRVCRQLTDHADDDDDDDRVDRARDLFGDDDDAQSSVKVGVLFARAMVMMMLDGGQSLVETVLTW